MKEYKSQLIDCKNRMSEEMDSYTYNTDRSKQRISFCYGRENLALNYAKTAMESLSRLTTSPLSFGEQTQITFSDIGALKVLSSKFNALRGEVYESYLNVDKALGKLKNALEDNITKRTKEIVQAMERETSDFSESIQEKSSLMDIAYFNLSEYKNCAK